MDFFTDVILLVLRKAYIWFRNNLRISLENVFQIGWTITLINAVARV